MRRQAVALLLAVALPALAVPLITVRVLGVDAGAEVGIVAVADGTGPVSATGPAPDLGLAGLGRAELFAFAQERSPVAIPILADAVEVEATLDAELAVPVHVWVLEGPFLDVAWKAYYDVLEAMRIWQGERTGLTVSNLSYSDGTGTATESALDFLCMNGTIDNLAALRDAFPPVDGALNVYYVRTVDGAYGRGQSCVFGKPHVVVSAYGPPGLLAHELGHAFWLDDHWEDIEPTPVGESKRNVMHSASNVREFFTEGQVVRTRFRKTLLTTLAGRPALDCATVANPFSIDPFFRDTFDCRHCKGDAGSADCPAQTARVWPDE